MRKQTYSILFFLLLFTVSNTFNKSFAQDICHLSTTPLPIGTSTHTLTGSNTISSYAECGLSDLNAGEIVFEVPENGTLYQVISDVSVRLMAYDNCCDEGCSRVAPLVGNFRQIDVVCGGYLVVDASSNTSFNMNVTVAGFASCAVQPPCANEVVPNCGEATPINCLSGLQGDLRIGSTNNFNSTHYEGCNTSNFDFNGYDDIYYFDKDKSSDVITVDLQHSPNINLSLFILDRCSSSPNGSQVRCRAKANNIGNPIIGEQWTDNGQLPAGRYYFVVDAATENQQGFYTLNVRCEGKLDCKPNRTLTCGKPDTWNTGNGSSNVSSYCGQERNDYQLAEVIYSFTPERSGEHIFNLTVPNSNEDRDMFLYQSSSCENLDVNQCLASSDGPSSTSPDQIRIDLEEGENYYIIVDNDIVGNTVRTGEFTIDVRCPLECKDLSDELPCFPYWNRPNRNFVFQFFPSITDARDIKLSIDGEYIDEDQWENYPYPIDRPLDICWEWIQEVNGEKVPYCYCKNIYVVYDLDDCDKVWAILNPNIGSTSPYVFLTNEKASMWTLNNGEELLDVVVEGDDRFSPEAYIPSEEILGNKETYVSMHYKDANDVLRSCTRKFCFDNPFSDIDEFSSAEDFIQPVFVGDKKEVREGNYSFQLNSTLPDGAKFIKWKWYPKNRGKEPNDVSISLSDSEDSSPTIDLYGGATSPGERGQSWCVCLVYEYMGCLYIECLELCLSWPYNLCYSDSNEECEFEQLQINAIECDKEEGVTYISVSYQAPDPGIPDLASKELLYWTDAAGNILQEGGDEFKLEHYTPYVYVWFNVYSGFTTIDMAGYWLEFFCIPIDYCGPSLECNKGSIGGTTKGSQNNWDKPRNGFGNCRGVTGCDFTGNDVLYQFEKTSETFEVNLRHGNGRENNLSLFVLDADFEEVVVINPETGEETCKGWNVNNLGEQSNTDVVGEDWSNAATALPNGVYYILVEGGCGNGNGLEADFKIEVNCDVECEDLSNTKACFPFWPSSNDGWIIGFFDDIEGAEGLQLMIDGQDVRPNNQAVYFLPEEYIGQKVEVCWKWEVNDGEFGRRCYQYCKRINFPSDPFDCDLLWQIPNPKADSAAYAFISQEPAVMWILHDQDGNNLDILRKGDDRFNQEYYLPQAVLADGMYFVTVYYQINGVLRVCCFKWCYSNAFNPNVELGQAEPSLIETFFVGERDQLKTDGIYNYRLTHNLPSNYRFVKWKWYPKYNGTNDSTDILDNLQVLNDSNEETLVIECPNGPRGPQDPQIDYCICLVYEVDGCLYTKCYSQCLVWPYDICENNEGPMCPDEDIFYASFCEGGSAVYGIFTPEIEDSQVLYWTNANGDVIQRGPENICTVESYTPYIYCYINRCSPYTVMPFPKQDPYCWVEVYCLPWPDSCELEDACADPVIVNCEGFESYNEGDEITEVSTDWTTSTESCIVRESAGNKYLEFIQDDRSSNVTYELPTVIADRKEISYRLFISEGSGMEQSFNTGGMFSSIYLAMQDYGGPNTSGIILTIAEAYATDTGTGTPYILIDFPYDSWFDVRWVLDVPTETISLYINDKLIVSVPNTGIQDFVSLNLTSSLSRGNGAKVDDICVKSCGGGNTECSVEGLSCLPLYYPFLVKFTATIGRRTSTNRNMLPRSAKRGKVESYRSISQTDCNSLYILKNLGTGDVDTLFALFLLFALDLSDVEEYELTIVNTGDDGSIEKVVLIFDGTIDEDVYEIDLPYLNEISPNPIAECFSIVKNNVVSANQSNYIFDATNSLYTDSSKTHFNWNVYYDDFSKPVSLYSNSPKLSVDLEDDFTGVLLTIVDDKGISSFYMSCKDFLNNCKSTSEDVKLIEVNHPREGNLDVILSSNVDFGDHVVYKVDYGDGNTQTFNSSAEFNGHRYSYVWDGHYIIRVDVEVICNIDSVKNCCIYSGSQPVLVECYTEESKSNIMSFDFREVNESGVLGSVQLDPLFLSLYDTTQIADYYSALDLDSFYFLFDSLYDLSFWFFEDIEVDSCVVDVHQKLQINDPLDIGNIQSVLNSADPKAAFFDFDLILEAPVQRIMAWGGPGEIIKEDETSAILRVKDTSQSNIVYVSYVDTFGIVRLNSTELDFSSLVTSIESQFEGDLSVNIHPNPFSDRLHISFAKEVQNSTIRIYDLLGRQQHISAYLNTDRITISEFENMPSGLYIMSIQDNEGQLTTKRIIKSD